MCRTMSSVFLVKSAKTFAKFTSIVAVSLRSSKRNTMTIEVDITSNSKVTVSPRI